MKYVFQFGIVWDHLPQLINGAWLTLRLSFGAFALGFALALLLAFLRTSGPKPARVAVAAYVEVIRNTPFLVQLFIIYFSLPAIGIRMEAVTAALIGMSINFSGYATEIVRSASDAAESHWSRVDWAGNNKLALINADGTLPAAGVNFAGMVWRHCS